MDKIAENDGTRKKDSESGRDSQLSGEKGRDLDILVKDIIDQENIKVEKLVRME